MNPEICELLSNGGLVSCYLADGDGNRLDPLDPSVHVCEEIQHPEGRDERTIILPEGNEVILQNIILRKAGNIVVEVTDGIDTCISEPIPFC